jgi:hypothetical protein
MHMNIFAKTYIASVLTVGASLLLAALVQWHTDNPARLVGYLLIGLAASTWKVRLPGITSTISGSFLFILIGASAFGFSETILLAATSAVLQSFWRARKQPPAVQVAFNAAVLSVSAASAWLTATEITRHLPGSLLVSLVAAASLYFVLNTGLVSGVIALVEEKKFGQVWRDCHGWSFPYYAMGAGVAAMITVSSHTAGWAMSLLIVPAMYLSFVYYRFDIAQATQERMRVAVNNEEHEMVVSTR